jgi:hypothetical protein
MPKSANFSVQLAGLVAIPVLCCLLTPPANAQSEDVIGGEQMRQFAPMLNMMKQHLGKRRFGQLMRTLGPMMADMQEGGGQGMALGGEGMGNIMNLLGSADGIAGLRGLAGFGMGHGHRHRWAHRHRSSD